MAGQIKLRPHVMQVFLAPEQSALPYRHHPVHAALALPDKERAALDVEVIPPERNHLHAPHPRAVKHLQNGSIPDAHRLGDVDAVQHLFNLGLAQDCLGQALIQPRQFQIRGRVAQKM